MKDLKYYQDFREENDLILKLFDKNCKKMVELQRIYKRNINQKGWIHQWIAKNAEKLYNKRKELWLGYFTERLYKILDEIKELNNFKEES